MLIPLGTDRPNKRNTIVTKVIIAINISIFVIMAILANANPELAARINDAGAISRHNFHAYQPISSAFLHAGFMHIFGNMIFLLVFGPSVEDRFGRIGFTVFYLVGGAVSGFAHIAVDPHPAIGASGAIAAVAGAFLVLFPNTRIKCFVIFFMIGIFMIPSWWLIGLFIVLDLFAQFFSADNGIANIAHLGGYGFGILIAWTLLITKILPKEPYDMFSLLKHKKRRADFRAANNHFANASVRVQDNKPVKIDPLVAQIAESRAHIGSLVSSNELTSAADAYLDMLTKFDANTKALTLHRDAQYQIASEFYQRGQRQEAFDAFARLLDAYPTDPERPVITILMARIKAQDLNDPQGALTMLTQLKSITLDDDTRALIDSDLDAINPSPESTT